MHQNKRWLQRFQSFQRTLYHLDAAVRKGHKNMSPLETQGFIKGFELCYELAWKTLQDYLHEQGYMGSGPKFTIEQAFKDGLIDGNAWKDMQLARNDAAHTYDEELALSLAKKIQQQYYPLLDKLDRTLTAVKNTLL